MRPRLRRPDRRALIALPNGFTLFNLFSGIFAIVLASRGRYGTAAFWVVLGGIADTLDGRVARATGTGSRFGEELDSLVDAISFGLAPALIMYFAVLNREGWDWIFVFFFTACAVMRLARFNVEQAGRAKTHFHGLPSPAAGMTLASYYWFSQTPLYNQTVILFTNNTTLSDLPWHVIMRFLMVCLAFFMVSDVPYPAVPTIGIRSLRQIVGSAIVLGSLLGLIFLPLQFIFPALVVYVLFPPLKTALFGFLDRRDPNIFQEEEPDDDEFGAPPPVVVARPTPALSVPVVGPSSAADSEPGAARRRKRRRRPRGDRSDRSDRPERPERPERSHGRDLPDSVTPNSTPQSSREGQTE
jgi:CDP-diacylglycerol--serine O-phosphatidyltransferase